MGDLFKKLRKKTKKLDKKMAKVVPKKARKTIAKGANKFSNEYDKVDKKIYKKLKSVPVVGKGLAEGYEFGNNYVHPFGTIKNASDVISGRQSLVEGVLSEYTPVGDLKYAQSFSERNK
jgi:hypothetical protein